MSKKSKRKPSFIISILSVAFVLFLLGLFALLVFQTNSLLTNLKENVEVNIFIEDFATDEDIELLQTDLQQKNYAKRIEYISKEEARNEFSNEFEMDLLEENPLPASISMYLNAKYANTDSLNLIAGRLQNYSQVSEVLYQKDIVDVLNTNVKKIAAILLAASIVFIIIAFTLIDSTIRLSIYSKRFIIKSMQLVGAKNSFITKPFIRKGIGNGFLSSLLAIVLLFGVIYFVNNSFQVINFEQDAQFLLILVAGIVVFGVLLSLLATWFSVRKYLTTKIEDLY